MDLGCGRGGPDARPHANTGGTAAIHVWPSGVIASEFLDEIGVGRAVLERRVIHIHDVTVDAEYGHSAISYRTLLAVPLLREGTAHHHDLVSWASSGQAPDDETNQ